MKTKHQGGFTLLEILLVVAAIGILAGIVIFAVNPAKQLGDTRNAQRKVDVNTILNAVWQYAIDNNGELPGGIGSDEVEICKTDENDCGIRVELTELTEGGRYLIAIPVDPQNQSSDEEGTGYNIMLDGNNHVRVFAPNAENGVEIMVTR